MSYSVHIFIIHRVLLSHFRVLREEIKPLCVYTSCVLVSGSLVFTAYLTKHCIGPNILQHLTWKLTVVWLKRVLKWTQTERFWCGRGWLEPRRKRCIVVHSRQEPGKGSTRAPGTNSDKNLLRLHRCFPDQYKILLTWIEAWIEVFVVV